MNATIAAPARNGADAAPVVQVRRSPSGRQLLVERCSYCRKRHFHGAGDDPERPALGHRVAHCADPLPSEARRRGTVEQARALRRAGYYLVAASEPPA